MKNKIKYFRELKGFTQEALAKRAKVSRAYVNQLESGRSGSPSVQIAIRLADTLGCTVEELFEKEKQVTCPEKDPVEILGWAISELNKLQSSWKDNPMFK